MSLFLCYLQCMMLGMAWTGYVICFDNNLLVFLQKRKTKKCETSIWRISKSLCIWPTSASYKVVYPFPHSSIRRPWDLNIMLKSVYLAPNPNQYCQKNFYHWGLDCPISTPVHFEDHLIDKGWVIHPSMGGYLLIKHIVWVCVCVYLCVCVYSHSQCS